MTPEDGRVSQPGGSPEDTDLAAALARSRVLAAVAPPSLRATPRVEALGQSHGPATRGIYRVAEAVRERGQPTAWSVILKILSPDAVPAPGRDDPTSYLYWRREMLSKDLPGWQATVVKAISRAIFIPTWRLAYYEDTGRQRDPRAIGVHITSEKSEIRNQKSEVAN